MDDELRARITNAVVKTTAAVLTGGGFVQLGDSEWLGRMAFDNFNQSASVNVLQEHLIGAEVYRRWGKDVMFGVTRDPIGPTALLYLLALLALVAHVLYRYTRAGDSASSAHDVTLANRSRRVIEWLLAGCRSCRTIYCRHYTWVNIVAFVSLLLFYWNADSRFQLLARFALISGPVSLYLLYYSKDVTSRKFEHLFSYIVMLIVFGLTIVALPKLYGERFFDVRLAQIATIEGQSALTSSLAIFVLDGERRTVVAFQRDQVLTLEIRVAKQYQASGTWTSLRQLAGPVSAGLGSQGRAQGLEDLTKLLQQN